MTRYLIGNLRTGRRLVDLNVVRGPWNTDLNSAGRVSATVTLNDPDMAGLLLRNAATVGQAFLAVVENDTVMEAGPIWTHEYDRDAGTLEISAAGIWSYFDHRVLVPVLAADQSPLGADTNLSGLDLGTIAKRLVQQARSHTGGNVPIVFEGDRGGGNERNYLGADLKLVGDALSDLTAVDGGPDIMFAPRFTADRLGIEWVLRTGTADRPRLAAVSAPHAWDLSVPEPAARKLRVNVTADRLVGRAWATGGRSADVALYSRFENQLLVDRGYPLLEAVDSTHSTVIRQGTLDGYTREAARTGSRPVEFWSFEVDAQTSPQVGEYQVGDYCTLQIGKDPYLPKGKHRRRIVALSGDEDGRWVSVTTGEVYSLDG